MTVTFYLKDGKAKSETPIYARFKLGGTQHKYYLPEKILPKHWNQKEQKARRTYTGFVSFNDLISTREAEMQDVYRSYIALNKAEPTLSVLKGLFDERIKPNTVKADEQKSFFGFFNHFIQQCEQGTRLNARGKPVSKGTVVSYKSTLSFMLEYQKTVKRPTDFETIDLEFYKGFVEFLTRKKLQATNTIGKHIKNLKAVLNDATDRGLNTNLAYKRKSFKKITEKTDSIYLTEEEIQEFANIDLSHKKGHEQVRDLFIVGCYTGLRFGDLAKLRPENIDGDFIKIKQNKTGEFVEIPVHPVVCDLMDKYCGELPKAITNQKTNKYLKEIGEDAPLLKTKQSRSITRGGFEMTSQLEKYKLITTHTARRSFATNNFLSGLSTLTIMAITGHKTEKAFLTYIKVTQNEHAKIMKLHWDKLSNTKAVVN